MELLKTTIKIIPKMILNIKSALSSVGGWLIGFMAFLASNFGQDIYLAHYILFCIFLDLIWGIASSIKRGKFLISGLFTKTPLKIAIYLSIFVGSTVISKIMTPNLDILPKITATLLCLSEIWSIMGHILIIKPNTPVVRIIKKYLVHEIEKKTGVKNIEKI